MNLSIIFNDLNYPTENNSFNLSFVFKSISSIPLIPLELLLRSAS